MPVPAPQLESAWPHRWSAGLVCATFPLIWVGGLVTTTDAGMAVPDWPNTYGYNLFLYPWTEWLLGPWDLFIEHGHRLLGALVGVLTISLVVVLCRCETRLWVRWFGVGLLFAVIGQGLLGGMRVVLDERTLAMIHACTGPLFFALTVAMAVVTSRKWRAVSESGLCSDGSGRLIPWLSAICAMTAFTQIVLGAQIRHVSLETTPSVFRLHVVSHIMIAFVLSPMLVWLVVATRSIFRGNSWVTHPTNWTAALILLQLGLGGATWFVSFAAPTWLVAMIGQINFVIPAGSRWQSLVVTAHVALGSLILAMLTVSLIRSARVAVGADTRGDQSNANQGALNKRLKREVATGAGRVGTSRSDHHRSTAVGSPSHRSFAAGSDGHESIAARSHFHEIMEVAV